MCSQRSASGSPDHRHQRLWTRLVHAAVCSRRLSRSRERDSEASGSSVWRNTAPPSLPGKHANSFASGCQGRSRGHLCVNRHTHTPLCCLCLPFVKDMRINKHSALSSCASVAVFLLAGCLCFALQQRRGGDALCNSRHVPGIWRGGEGWRRV